MPRTCKNNSNHLFKSLIEARIKTLSTIISTTHMLYTLEAAFEKRQVLRHMLEEYERQK